MTDFYDRALAELAPYGEIDDQRTDPLKWWRDQAVMERARALRAEAEVAQGNSAGDWGRECALVALRMLKRAGKLKATTDDERKVIEWAEQVPTLHAPGAQRRLGSPFAEHYSDTADVAAQAVLFDMNSQESVNNREAA